MVVVPTVTPDTTPDALTVATPGLLLAHAPPGVMVPSVIVVPKHTPEGPVSGAGIGLTVMSLVTKQPEVVLV